MPPMRIVPALDELKHLAAGLALRPEGPPVDQVALPWAGLVAVTVAWIGTELRGIRQTGIVPPVLRLERLEVVEPTGELAMVLANSRRPAVATLDGQILMAGQEEERRGRPSIVFFDGQGDEVGGMQFGSGETEGGPSATRHFSLDAYEQDQTVVLHHYQSPAGSSSGLTISDRPATSLVESLAELGLRLGASRDEYAAAAIPEGGREARLRELFGGTERAFVGTDVDGTANLTLQDGEGRPRIVIEVPASGEPAIRILDEAGEPVLNLPSN